MTGRQGPSQFECRKAWVLCRTVLPGSVQGSGQKPLTTTASLTPDGKTAPPIRLDYLDGLRAVTALYVILFHIWQFYQMRMVSALPLPVWRALHWMAYGRSAVGIFIVLSGYCLMLPVARSGALRGGVRDFFRRRARRILPPYYAALLGIPVIHLLRHHAWLPMTRGVFLSHLFLIHNWFPRWEYEIDVPMWSVAAECQIYLFFPLLLLPLWRRFGVGAAVAAAFIVGLAPHYLWHRFDETNPWYLGLFALGMAGAVIAHAPEDRTRGRLRRVPWGLAAALFGLAFVIEVLWSQVGSGQRFDPSADRLLNVWQADLIVGLATTCLLIHGAQRGGHASAPVRLLSARRLVALGTFSYSLYLVHHPVLRIVLDALLLLRLGTVTTFLLFVVFGVGVAIAAAYGFFLAFERPFLVRRGQEKPAETARDAALSPAP